MIYEIILDEGESCANNESYDMLCVKLHFARHREVAVLGRSKRPPDSHSVAARHP